MNDIKQLNSFYGNPPEGNFALEIFLEKGIHWDHCLEQFAAKFTKNTLGFFFSHPVNKGSSVSSFILKIEEILNLKEKTLFKKTNKENILWIKPSSFWKNCILKRSLFTILLRTSFNYDEKSNNIEETLFSPNFKENKYIKETKNAVIRFLFGFTDFKGKLPLIDKKCTVVKHGWHSEFKNSDLFSIKIKLNRKDYKLTDKDLLWI